LAIAEGVIFPDMTRESLQTWVNSCREQPSKADLKNLESDPGASIDPSEDPGESDAVSGQDREEWEACLRLASAASKARRCEQKGRRIPPDQDEAAVSVCCSILNFVAPLYRKCQELAEVKSHLRPRARQALVFACLKQAQRWGNLADQFDCPLSSPDDQQAFDVLKAAWANGGVLTAQSWASASTLVKERFIADVLRADVPLRVTVRKSTDSL
jgi:hypothetical protein